MHVNIYTQIAWHCMQTISWIWKDGLGLWTKRSALIMNTRIQIWSKDGVCLNGIVIDFVSD